MCLWVFTFFIFTSSCTHAHLFMHVYRWLMRACAMFINLICESSSPAPCSNEMHETPCKNYAFIYQKVPANVAILCVCVCIWMSRYFRKCSLFDMHTCFCVLGMNHWLFFLSCRGGYKGRASTRRMTWSWAEKQQVHDRSWMMWDVETYGHSKAHKKTPRLVADQPERAPLCDV